MKGAHTVHVHVLEECAGWNCPDNAAIGNGQVSHDFFSHCAWLTFIIADHASPVCPHARRVCCTLTDFTRHAFELYDLFEHHKLEARYSKFEMHLFAHWPWLADPSAYYPLNTRPTASERIRRVLDVDGILGYHRPVGISPIDYRQAEICLFTRCGP